MAGLIGRKVGMTQIFDDGGALIPVTVLEAGPCRVTQVKDPARDGYAAIQVGFGEVPERVLSRPERGHLARSSSPALRFLREFRVPDASAYQPGQLLTVAMLHPGSRVDVTGTSKGRGFSGVMKRHGFSGFPETHGSKNTHRIPGSIGSNTFPGRVWKNMRMAGHYGAARVTALNLRVCRVDAERHLVFLAGAVPGATNSLVLIRPRGERASGE